MSKLIRAISRELGKADSYGVGMIKISKGMGEAILRHLTQMSIVEEAIGYYPATDQWADNVIAEITEREDRIVKLEKLESEQFTKRAKLIGDIQRLLP